MKIQQTEEKYQIDDSCSSTPQKDASFAGSYQLIRRIQTGGQASIYLATKMDNQFAIKIYNEGPLQDKAFDNQTQIFQRLQFKGLVPIVESFRNVYFKWQNQAIKSVHIIVMPLMQHGDLFQWISKNGILTEDIARYFAKKIISTFRYLTSQYICHRDIKPQNILLDDHYEPLILDFGLSMDSRHKLHNFVSDIRYASPQVIKHCQYTQKSEIYSIGILLFYVLTGQYPFHHAKICDQVYRLLVQRKYHHFWEKVQFKIKKRLSPNFKEIFLAMICHNSIKRPNFDNVLEYSWLNEKQPTLHQYEQVMKNMNQHCLHKKTTER